MPRWLTTAILPLALSACEVSEPRVEAVPPERAAALYGEHCAICHGSAGDGRGPRRGSLYAKPPDFRREDWRRGKSLPEVRQVIREGRPGTDMPGWAVLEDAEVAGLAEHVLAFAGGRADRARR